MACRSRLPPAHSRPLLLIAGLLVAAGCGAGGATMSLVVKSDAFAHGGNIPETYTEDGKDISPPLAWEQVPPHTASLALICDDPDAPSREPWVHWVIYDIAGSARSLPQGVPPNAEPHSAKGAIQGKNSWGTIGYRGPAPPKKHGPHHYHFHLYALDAPVALKPGASKSELLSAIEGHILAEGELVGVYQR